MPEEDFTPHGTSADYDTIRAEGPVETEEDLVDPWWVWALTFLACSWLAATVAWTRTVAIVRVPRPDGMLWDVHWGATTVLVLQFAMSAWLLVHLVRTALRDRLRGRDGVLAVVACVVSAAMTLVTWAILR